MKHPSSSRELLTMLGVPEQASAGKVLHRCDEFPLKVPRAYLSRVAPGRLDDPLLRQVLPLNDERRHDGDYSDDPVGDGAARRGGAILHKYRNRVLLVATGACAIHCRYCFRRHFPYREHSAPGRLEQALRYIRSDPKIEEVIISGGDPLTLSNRRFFNTCEQLEAIPQVLRIRIHTRVPVVDPARMDRAWLAWSARRGKPYVMVLHINHPNEIGDEAAAVLEKIKHLVLLNQSVLLKGVNDDADTLVALSRRCFEVGILPYYLHLLDRVRGAAHFDVDEAVARELMRRVSARLPGYLVPKLVRETEGENAKTLVAY